MSDLVFLPLTRNTSGDTGILVQDVGDDACDYMTAVETIGKLRAIIEQMQHEKNHTLEIAETARMERDKALAEVAAAHSIIGRLSDAVNANDQEQQALKDEIAELKQSRELLLGDADKRRERLAADLRLAGEQLHAAKTERDKARSLVAELEAVIATLQDANDRITGEIQPNTKADLAAVVGGSVSSAIVGQTEPQETKL